MNIYLLFCDIVITTSFMCFLKENTILRFDWLY